MSFIHVAPILKKAKKIVMYEDGRGKQWVGDSCSAYRLYDIPFRVDHENLLDMMGMEGKKDKFLSFYKQLPDVFLGDYGEKVDWQLPFMYDGELYQVIRSGNATICILEHYLKPLRKIDNKEYRIEEANGIRYLVVNVGAMAIAVLAGEPVSENVVQKLQWTVDCLEAIAVPGERNLFDPATGEVMADE